MLNIREELDKRSALMTAAEGMLNAGLETQEKRDAYDEKINEIHALDEVLSRAQGFDGLKSKKFTPVADDQSLGFGPRELEQYSIVRGIRALSEARTGRSDAWEKFAPFELEASRAMAAKLGKNPQGFWVPQDVMKEKRDLTVGTPADGGYFKATELKSMIEMLRYKMVLKEAGATMITGLVGDVAFPKHVSGGTAYWVAEGVAPTESQMTIGQVVMQPKTLGAYTEYSRKLVLQSSVDIENFVRGDLASIIAREVDRAGLHGSGASGQPTGVALTSGIGSVVGGTNGLAPTWIHITQLEREVAIDNADDGNLAYITNPKVRYKLKNTYRNATYGEIPIWGDTREQPLNGYPAKVTNQVSSALTKGSSSGVASAIFFGNWAELLIGFWSGIDILLDPYSLSTTGGTRIVALQDVDVAVRHAESFAAMLDVLTV